MDSPQYPSVKGQQIPDLELAQYGMATPETAIALTADSTPSVDRGLPLLAGGDLADSINQMGIDPAVPYFDLQLANTFEVMTPDQLAAPARNGLVNLPTYSQPQMEVPDLKMGDLQAPEILQVPELQPDPHLSDLLEFAHPGGLTIIAASSSPLAIDPIDPMAADLDEDDRPAGLDIPAPLMPDPLLPDLQHPTLQQDVEMTGRPGDLSPTALGILHTNSDYTQLPDDSYNALFMQQAGNNQHRERHLGMMYLGLDKEEG